MGRGFWDFYERANNVIRTFTGPADIGAGHPEAPEVRSTEAPCPLCGAPMSAHRFERGHDQRQPTRLVCPSDLAA